MTTAVRLDNSKRYKMVDPRRLLLKYKTTPFILKYDRSKSSTIIDILNQFAD